MCNRVACLFATLALAATSPSAETVYRCTIDGRTVYAAQASAGQCEARDLRDETPAPEAVKRQQGELEAWSRQREQAVQRSLDREAADRIQRRQAELSALGPAHAAGGRQGSRRRRESSKAYAPAPAATAAPLPPNRMGVAGRR